jgi:hypothetical protein
MKIITKNKFGEANAILKVNFQNLPHNMISLIHP